MKVAILLAAIVAAPQGVVASQLTLFGVTPGDEIRVISPSEVPADVRYTVYRTAAPPLPGVRRLEPGLNVVPVESLGVVSDATVAFESARTLISAEAAEVAIAGSLPLWAPLRLDSFFGGRIILGFPSSGRVRLVARDQSGLIIGEREVTGVSETKTVEIASMVGTQRLRGGTIRMEPLEGAFTATMRIDWRGGWSIVPASSSSVPEPSNRRRATNPVDRCTESRFLLHVEPRAICAFSADGSVGVVAPQSGASYSFRGRGINPYAGFGTAVLLAAREAGVALVDVTETMSGCSETRTAIVEIVGPPVVASFTAENGVVGMATKATWSVRGEVRSQSIRGDFGTVELDPSARLYGWTPSSAGSKNVELTVTGPCGTTTATATYTVQ